MRNILAIAKREFFAYFGSPVAYIAIAVFLVLLGVIFFFKIPFLLPKEDFFEAKEATLRPMFEWMVFLFTIFLPAISMRLLAEEKKLKRHLCVSLEPRRRKVGNIDIFPYKDFLDLLWDEAFK